MSTPCKLVCKFTFGNEQLIWFETEYVKICDWKVIEITYKHVNMCLERLQWKFMNIRLKNFKPPNIKMYKKKNNFKSHFRTRPNL